MVQVSYPPLYIHKNWPVIYNPPSLGKEGSPTQVHSPLPPSISGHPPLTQTKQGYPPSTHLYGNGWFVLVLLPLYPCVFSILKVHHICCFKPLTYPPCGDPSPSPYPSTPFFSSIYIDLPKFFSPTCVLFIAWFAGLPSPPPPAAKNWSCLCQSSLTTPWYQTLHFGTSSPFGPSPFPLLWSSTSIPFRDT